MKEKSILITGVAGMIGSRLADWIIDNGLNYNVIGIDNLLGGYIDNVNDKVILYDRDLSKDDIEDIFKTYDIEYVFHLAAYAAEGLSPFMRKFNYMNNVGSTVNIINNCITYNIKRLVYASSMSVYGYGEYKRFDESIKPNPIDPYGISKYACEMDIQVAADQHGLDFCIIRPHNVYGIKQNIWDKYRNVLGIWIRQILNNQKITIFGDGLQKRSFTFVDDIVPYIWKCAISDKAKNEIFNLGSLQEITILDAAKMLCDINNIGYDNIDFLEARHEVKNAVPLGTKSVELLDYKDKTNLKEGLAKMVKWAKTQPNREVKKWENYEINKGIYEFWK